ncbi:unnamed protein product [Psylliodes chrysocephalus]|uniref:Uncharacterized protein n=1 Tax=Psylliodes chrysocephalus TaxID=3402493 RepID=A0A9P0G9Q3_9CUCU|nr:unnamed protein product [Psylliodes chrysocephala]
MSDKKVTIVKIDQRPKIYDAEDKSPILYIDVTKDDKEIDIFSRKHVNSFSETEEESVRIYIEKNDDDEKKSQDSFCSAEEVKINCEDLYGALSKYDFNQNTIEDPHNEDYQMSQSSTENIKIIPDNLYKEIFKGNHIKYCPQSVNTNTQEEKRAKELTLNPENFYEEISKAALTNEALKNHDEKLLQDVLNEVKVDTQKGYAVYKAAETEDKTSITADKDENETSDGSMNSDDDPVHVAMQMFPDIDKKDDSQIDVKDVIKPKEKTEKKSWSEIFWTTGVDYFKLCSDVCTVGFVFWVILLIFYKGSSYTKKSLPGYHGHNAKYY